MLATVRSLIAPLAPALGLAALVAAPAFAQGSAPPAPPVPQITTTARGETQVTPDRATVNIGVQTHGQTAAAAAAANAQLQRRVTDAIKGAGIPAAQIRTVGFNVAPEYAYDQGKPPRVTGYRAANTVLVEVRAIDQVGKILDTAIGAGANTIHSIEFYSSGINEARRTALERAVEAARLDAEAMARAAGGTLGALLELASVEYNIPGPRPVMMARMAAGVAMEAAPTPIEAGEYTVTASISARWQFTPRPR